jgi:hypothetical protein
MKMVSRDLDEAGSELIFQPLGAFFFRLTGILDLSINHSFDDLA